MRSWAKSLGWWVAVAGWTVVIFWFSSQPDLKSGLETWQDLVLRKLAHAVEYFTLAYFWAHAVTDRWGRRWAVGIAAVAAFATAGLDEAYQLTVRGRSGSPLDVAIDGVGVVAFTLLYLRQRNQA